MRLRKELQFGFLGMVYASISLFPMNGLSNDVFRVENLRLEYKVNPLGIETKKPRMSWQIRSDKRNTLQTGYEIQCASTKENLSAGRDLIWNTKVNTDQSIHIEYQGRELQSREKIYWQVRVWDNHGRVSLWSEPAYWEMGLLNEKDWAADWIEANIEENIKTSQPAQYYRKKFQSKKAINSARLYITSRGLYEAYLNNERVGNQVFTPGWTSYNKRIQYQVYDVTDMINKGENAIGVVLGDGWFRGYLGWKDRRNVYGTKLAVLAQLELLFTDGTKKIINTNTAWKATIDGPIVRSDIYMGETYDARKRMDGWSRAGYNDSAWGEVSVADYSVNQLFTSFGPPVRKLNKIKPVYITEMENGRYLFDMGQNMVGWLRLKVKGQKGKTIKIRHAEVLDKTGKIYTENLRTAAQTIEYICGSDQQEIYEPKFTFQGFRFVEVSGFPGKPDLESLTGIVIHSDMKPTGSFKCSDPLINQLQHNIQWGLKGNFLDVPTDCPQRDERLGWTGDAQVFAPTACFNVDAASFYTKWLVDLALDQGDDGKVNDVIPDVLNGGGGHTGWADAAIVIPWTIYLNYGDKRILENQYESMKAWIEYMKKKAGDDGIWQHDWHYGDWLSYDDDSPAYMGAYTETDLIATAYYAYSTSLMAKIAQALGKNDDAKKFNINADKIKKAFLNEFISPNGRLVSDTQTAYTLTLAMDLVPETHKKRIAENFYHSVNKFKHITTGFLGTPLICQTLTKFGYIDMAYALLNRKEYPSWLYPVTMGATTIWERWDGIKPDSTFQDAGMNSFNHYAYGAIGKWLYSTVAGLDLDENDPGYKKFVVNPNPGGGLTYATAELMTMYGQVKSSWQEKEGMLTLEVRVPPNTTAEVHLPSDNKQNILEGGKSLADHPVIVVGGVQNGKTIVRLGSGDYQFKISQN